jgi:curli production assembly/transport component CsgF
MKTVFIFMWVGLFSWTIWCQEIVYRPMNPSFLGGNPYNAAALLASAEAQNDFKEETEGYEEKSELEQLTESLNRQLLNQLSQDLFNQEYGDDSFTVGTYSFGSLVVEITPTVGGLSIDIFDVNTGEQTQIIIPN